MSEFTDPYAKERFATDTYCVIGNPIAQSKSPLIHMQFAQVTGQTMLYDRILGTLHADGSSGFKADVDAFRARGGLGLNITTPFKLDAFAYANRHTERAKLAGAANCLKFEGAVATADNFDGVGLVRDIVHNLQTPLQGQRVLLLGAGGAIRGALLPFLAERPAELVIANRDLDKAQALVRIAAEHAPGLPVRAAAYADLADLRAESGPSGAAFAVVVNGTSAGLANECPPAPAEAFAGCGLAYDMTYGKGLTPFLRLAQRGGAARLADGVGMLAEQAAEAFLWWRGLRPSTADVIRKITVPLA
jgi:shikimate dehydrogenase